MTKYFSLMSRRFEYVWLQYSHLGPRTCYFPPQQNLSNSALMVRFSFSPLLNVVRYYCSLAVHSYDRVKRRRQVSAMKGMVIDKLPSTDGDSLIQLHQHAYVDFSDHLQHSSNELIIIPHG